MPPSDERSNFRLVQETLLARLERAPRAVHRIPGELGAEAAAAAYERELRGVTLDLALLGIGEDGHTASLFPHSRALDEAERLVAAVPDAEPQRVTLTRGALGAAALVVFLAVGPEKAEPARLALAAEPDPGTPASLVRARRGRTLAVLDRAAAAGLRV